MQKCTILTEADIKNLISDVMESVLKKELPPILRESILKKYLTKEELKELTGWSDRTIQRLRDNREIPFTQHKQKIIYPTDGIEEFLRNHQVETSEN